MLRLKIAKLANLTHSSKKVTSFINLVDIYGVGVALMTLSEEEKAIADWLEGSPIPELQRKYDLPNLEKRRSEVFTCFVNAAIDYHADSEMTHQGAAKAHNIPLWIYESCLSKFSVDYTPGEEGKRKAEELKSNPLYHPGD